VVITGKTSAEDAAGGGAKHVSGFVSLVGRPNAGKSTLLNRLIGTKLAIVSSKPQTTRASVQGVLTIEGAQIVFLDTPGVHQGREAIHRRMADSVRAALEERDVIVWLADASRPFDPADADALRIIEPAGAPKLLVLNKVDLVKDKRQLLPLMDHYRQAAPFEELFPVSAQTGEGTADLLRAILARLPEGPQYFPADFLTDQPERYLAGELIREKVLDATRQEVPHAVAVIVDEWKQSPRLTRVTATILVEREGQKRIVIGTRGDLLKRIGTLARQEMERLFGGRFFLDLAVKVRPNWRESREFLNELDWRCMAGGDSE
jgi:GTP-binding protein Era